MQSSPAGSPVSDLVWLPSSGSHGRAAPRWPEPQVRLRQGSGPAWSRDAGRAGLALARRGIPSPARRRQGRGPAGLSVPNPRRRDRGAGSDRRNRRRSPGSADPGIRLSARRLPVDDSRRSAPSGGGVRRRRGSRDALVTGCVREVGAARARRAARPGRPGSRRSARASSMPAVWSSTPTCSRM